MTTINPYFTTTPSYTAQEDDVGASRGSSASLFQAARQQSTDLAITTAEGDRVTLSYGQETSISHSSYGNYVQNGSGVAAEQGESLGFESSFGFSFSVEGDLSEQEMADIVGLVDDLDSVMGRMLTGDMDGALQEALEVGSFDTIAGFEANLLVEQQVYSERSYMIEAPAEGLNPLGMEPGGGLLDSVMFDEMLGLMDDMIDRMMESVDDTGMEPEKIEKPLDGYFAALKEKLMQGEGEEEESPSVRMADLVHSRLMAELQIESGKGNPELPGDVAAS